MRVCPRCSVVDESGGRFCVSCGESLPEIGADPLVGRVFGGTYTIQQVLGVGGMGRVYRAEQSSLGRTVAIKTIHPHLLSDEQTVARFYTEAKASSRLNHPHTVSVIDFGRTEDGILYLVMEFLEGPDLSTLIHREGPFPFVRIVDLMIQVLDALVEAHAQEIVHRDLKPENIIVRRLRNGGEQAKVVDFGLATMFDGSGAISRPGLVCGTPDYMSPEQAEDRTSELPKTTGRGSRGCSRGAVT